MRGTRTWEPARTTISLAAALGMMLLVAALIPPSASAQEAGPVTPEFNCVEYRGDGVLAVWFGYDNPTGETVEVEVGDPDNYFEGFSEDRGQPTEFEPGQHEQVFAVTTFSPDSLTWHLLGNSVTGPEDLAGEACDIEEPTLEMTGPAQAEHGENLDYDVTVQTGGFIGDLTVVIPVAPELQIDDVDFDELLGWDDQVISDCTIDHDANEVTCEYFSGHPQEGQHSEEFSATVSVTVTDDRCGTATTDAALSGEAAIASGFYGLDDPIDTAQVNTDIVGCTAGLTVAKAVAGDVAEDATFEFELMCESLEASETFELADGESTTLEVDADQQCTVLEIERGDADSTTYAIDGGDPVSGAEVTVDIPDEGVVEVLFTNTFDPEPVTEVEDDTDEPAPDVLPETGLDLGWLVAIGLLLLATGAALHGRLLARR